MNALKSLYLYLNKHSKGLAITWAATLVPVAVVPALGWPVAAAVLALCVLMFIGDYPMGWIDELEIK